jgi:hypothetical protein
VAVLGKEEPAGELAAQAGEEPACRLDRHLVDAHAHGARPLHVVARSREAGRGLEDLQLAVVVEEPLLAAPGGELVMQACARHVQGAQHRRGRLRPRPRAGGPEQPQPACQGRAGPRRDVEGAGAVEHPPEPLAEDAGRGQGRGVAGHQQAAVGVRAAHRRADVGLALEQDGARAGPGQLEGAAHTDRACAHHQHVRAFRHRAPRVAYRRAARAASMLIVS